MSDPSHLTMADLVKALEPFAREADAWRNSEDDTTPLDWSNATSEEPVTLGDVRTLARIASALPAYVLAPKEEEGDFAQLRRVNAERQEAWTEGRAVSLLFRATELGGEVGELLNVVKKIERERSGWRGSRATLDDLAAELASLRTRLAAVQQLVEAKDQLIADLCGHLSDEGDDWSNEGLDNMRRRVANTVPLEMLPDWLHAYRDAEVVALFPATEGEGH